MPKFPPVKGKQVLKIFLAFGYELDHVNGSHHILRNQSGKKITVPIHGAAEIPKGTLLGILSDAGITKEEFLKML